MYNSVIKMIALSLLLTSWVANAALVQWDAFDEGDNLAVKDQTTGLIWLDLTLTAGFSYNDAGDLYTGWGYADTAQVSSLFSTAFMNYSDNSGEGAFLSCQRGAACYTDASDFTTLFGYTPHALAPSFHYSFGMFADNSNDLRMSGAIVQTPLANANIYSDDYLRDYNGFRENSVYNLSTYLIKLPDLEKSNDGNDDPDTAALDLPEPSALGLVMGFLSLMLVSNSVKRSKLNL